MLGPVSPTICSGWLLAGHQRHNTGPLMYVLPCCGLAGHTMTKDRDIVLENEKRQEQFEVDAAYGRA